MLFGVSIGNAQQHAPKTWTTITILGWEVCAAIKRLPVGCKKRRQRPSALPAYRLHGSLIAAVNVRTLVAIHLHRDEMLVHDRRNLGIVIGLAIHHMAPVAPHRTNVEQHGFVVELCRGKSLRA